jgi:16S rRNA (cytidine1402-2'-O)-methyltransferase
MMASGMNGQSFTFHGYLPIEKGKKSSPKNLEKISKNQSQIFIETPYRNNKMLEDILQALHPETICVLLLILLTNRIYQNEESICLEKKTSICTIDPPFFIIHKCSFLSLC